MRGLYMDLGLVGVFLYGYGTTGYDLYSEYQNLGESTVVVDVTDIEQEQPIRFQELSAASLLASQQEDTLASPQKETKQEETEL